MPLRVGDAVRIYKPRHAEHGLRGEIGDISDGLVWPTTAWHAAEISIAQPWPLDQVISEADYRRLRGLSPFGALWRA